MVWWFYVPNIVFGEDALDELEQIKGKKAFIVTDKVVNSLGLTERVCSILTNRQWEAAIWDGAVPDPKVSTVKAAAEAIKHFGADWIIAVGGGSVIDTAKAAWVLYERPDIELHALTPFDELGLRAKAKLACIPTTAGTGSEATKAIVIRDDETGRKFATINPELTPDLAILDPEFVVGLPKELTAYTGMDALTHAVEGYISIWKNDFSDGSSLQALKMVFEWLPKSLDDLSDLESREKMLVAACLAGMSFGNSQAALAHSLGHSMGSVLRTHHGMSVGMALPFTIEFNCRGKENEEIAKQYTELARMIGIAGKKPETVSLKFATAIRELMTKIGNPQSFKEAGIKKKDFNAGLENMVEFAMMDTSLTMNPRNIDSDEIRKIYKYMYDGTVIDF
ncbi:MAG: iron-containing alcohol dehydrogenase [Candidatus Thorarchaeota archaeon]|nr:MAG: iron-containing alcohol dehydrogenase [Candidatus Thorarchaeota archaeon]